MIYEILGTIAMILAVIGVYLNNHKLIMCFCFFLISNCICLYLHSHFQIWSMCARDAILILLALHGWHKWRGVKVDK